MRGNMFIKTLRQSKVEARVWSIQALIKVMVLVVMELFN